MLQEDWDAERSLIASLELYFDHGLLIIEAPQSSAMHDDWFARTERIHFDTDSLWVPVRHDVDGPVSVSVHEHPAPATPGLTEVFSGRFTSATREVKLHDSESIVEVTAYVRSVAIAMRVLVDDVQHTSRVMVVLAGCDRV